MGPVPCPPLPGRPAGAGTTPSTAPALLEPRLPATRDSGWGGYPSPLLAPLSHPHLHNHPIIKFSSIQPFCVESCVLLGPGQIQKEAILTRDHALPGWFGDVWGSPHLPDYCPSSHCRTLWVREEHLQPIPWLRRDPRQETPCPDSAWDKCRDTSTSRRLRFVYSGWSVSPYTYFKRSSCSQEPMIVPPGSNDEW